MIRSGERGSVVGFIVVGVLLAILVLGGIYAVKQLASGAFDKPAEEVAVNVQQTTDETKKAVEESTQKDTNTASTESEKKAEESTPAANDRSQQKQRKKRRSQYQMRSQAKNLHNQLRQAQCHRPVRIRLPCLTQAQQTQCCRLLVLQL